MFEPQPVCVEQILRNKCLNAHLRMRRLHASLEVIARAATAAPGPPLDMLGYDKCEQASAGNGRQVVVGGTACQPWWKVGCQLLQAALPVASNHVHMCHSSWVVPPPLGCLHVRPCVRHGRQRLAALSYAAGAALALLVVLAGLRGPGTGPAR